MTSDRDQQDLARRAVGQHLTGVRYVDIDYFRDEVDPTATGPRTVTDETEWAHATWATAGADRLDHGVELALDDGSCLTVTWDGGGSLVLSSAPLVVLHADDDVADWSEAARYSRHWAGLLGERVDDVRLADDVLTLVLGPVAVDVVLGDADDDGTEHPSSDNLLVRRRA